MARPIGTCPVASAPVARSAVQWRKKWPERRGRPYLGVSRRSGKRGLSRKRRIRRLLRGYCRGGGFRDGILFRNLWRRGLVRFDRGRLVAHDELLHMLTCPPQPALHGSDR